MSIVKKVLGTINHSHSSSFFTYFFSALLNLFVSYGLLLFLLRVLPKEQYGQYGFYISVFSLILILFNFGHKEVIFKYSSQQNVNQSYSKILGVFKTFFIWNGFVFFVIQVLFFIDITLYLIATVFLFNSWLVTCAAYYRGKAIYKLDAYALPTQRAIWLLCCVIFYCLFDSITLISLFTSALIATSICLIWISYPLFTLFKTRVKSFESENASLKLLFSFFFIELASVFYLKADVLLLRLFNIELTLMADYFFAIQLFEIIVLIIMPIGYFYFNDLSKIKKISIKKYWFPMLGIVFLAHITLFFLAPIIFPLVIPNYISSIDTILMMIFSLYPITINVLLSSKLIFENKEVLFAKICFTALIFNIVSNIILIPYFEIKAVLLTKFCTELLITLLLVRFFQKTSDKR